MATPFDDDLKVYYEQLHTVEAALRSPLINEKSRQELLKAKQEVERLIHQTTEARKQFKQENSASGGNRSRQSANRRSAKTDEERRSKQWDFERERMSHRAQQAENRRANQESRRQSERERHEFREQEQQARREADERRRQEREERRSYEEQQRVERQAQKEAEQEARHQQRMEETYQRYKLQRQNQKQLQRQIARRQRRANTARAIRNAGVASKRQKYAQAQTGGKREMPRAYSSSTQQNVTHNAHVKAYDTILGSGGIEVAYYTGASFATAALVSTRVHDIDWALGVLGVSFFVAGGAREDSTIRDLALGALSGSAAVFTLRMLGKLNRFNGQQ